MAVDAGVTLRRDIVAGRRVAAKDYLLKDVSLEQLVHAVETVHNGGTLVQPVLTEPITRSFSESTANFSASNRPENLTERETEVLRLMSGGMSNKEFANVLHLSEGTIKNHVSNILAKLGGESVPGRFWRRLIWLCFHPGKCADRTPALV